MSTGSRPGKLQAWYDAHRSHGRAGPFRDAKQHVYHVLRCPCGERLTWTDAEAEAEPLEHALAAPDAVRASGGVAA